MSNESISSLNVSPNFTTKESSLAEQKLRKMIQQAETFGVEISDVEATNDQIIDTVRENNPERLYLVERRLAEEGLALGLLTREVLLDRLLGLDTIIEVADDKFGIDVTTGKDTVRFNKTVKANELKPSYERLGIDHVVVLGMRNEDLSEDSIRDDSILSFFAHLEDVTAFKGQSPFVLNLKY